MVLRACLGATRKYSQRDDLGGESYDCQHGSKGMNLLPPRPYGPQIRWGCSGIPSHKAVINRDVHRLRHRCDAHHQQRGAGNEPKFTGSPACFQKNSPQHGTQHRPNYEYWHHAGERFGNRLLQLDEARRTEYRHGSRDTSSVTKKDARRQSRTDQRDNGCHNLHQHNLQIRVDSTTTGFRVMHPVS